MSGPYRDFRSQVSELTAADLGASVSQVDALAKYMRDLAHGGLDPMTPRLDLSNELTRLADLHARQENRAVRARTALGATVGLLVLAFAKISHGSEFLEVGLVAVFVLTIPALAWTDAYVKALDRFRAALTLLGAEVAKLPMSNSMAILGTGVRVAVAVPRPVEVADERSPVAHSEAHKERKP